MTESEQCCVILSLFGQGLGYLIFTYKTKTLAVLCIELIIAPSKNLSLSHAPRKWRRQPGERRSSGTCKHYFQYFFRYTCSCYTLWLVNCDSWLQYYVIYLASPAQAKKHVERVNPQTPHLLTPWHLIFWHKKRCFRKWADWDIWKDAHRLPPSLFPPFLSSSLFRCSLDFFVRWHWPRAWQLTVFSLYNVRRQSTKCTSRLCVFKIPNSLTEIG